MNARRLLIVLGVAAAASIPLHGTLRRAGEKPWRIHHLPPDAPITKQSKSEQREPVRVLSAELGAGPRTSTTPKRTDPLGNPIVGQEHREVLPGGNEVYAAELAPGYDDVRPIPAEGDDEAIGPPPAPQPPAAVAAAAAAAQAQVDPTEFGYASLHDMEVAMRGFLKIPPEHHVTFAIEERRGRRGLGVRVTPSEDAERSQRTDPAL